MADAHKELARALTNRGAGAAVVAADCAPWWSATFSGVRHRLTLTGDTAAIGRIADGLEEHAFDLSGHIVADIAVTERAEKRIAIEALTIEDI